MSSREGMPRELGPEQLSIVRLIAEGMTNAQIGRNLGLRESAVVVQCSNIFDKLGVSNRGAAAHWFRNSGRPDVALPDPAAMAAFVAGVERLEAAELSVLDLLADYPGSSNAQLAAKAGISVSRLKAHKGKIVRKCGFTGPNSALLLTACRLATRGPTA